MLTKLGLENRFFWVSLIFVAILLVNFLSSITYPDEDAAILFRYAENLANTGVISYNVGGERVEGATDFLWMLAISVLNIFGFEPFFSALTFTFISLIATIWCFSGGNTQRGFIWFFVFLCTPFVWAGVGGFSNILFGFAYLICLKCLYHKKIGPFYFSVLVLCLIRPDGVIYSLAPFIYSFLRFEKANKKSIISSLAFLIIPGAVYFALRYNYFQQLLPLPFYVKSTIYKESIINTTFLYQNLLLIFATLPVITSTMAGLKNRIKKIEYITFIITPVLIYSFFSPDQNMGLRFQYPLFIFIIYTYIYHHPDTKISSGKFVCLIFFLLFPTLVSIHYTFNRAYENSIPLSDQIHKISKGSGVLLTTEAGKVPYNSRLLTIDAWGLNTSKFSKRVISIDDVREINPDLVHFHSENHDYSFILNEQEKANRTIKTWNNMSLNIYHALDKNDYSLFLLPYWSKNSIFTNQLKKASDYLSGFVNKKYVSSINKRYDVIMIKKSYIYHDRLVTSLKKLNSLNVQEYRDSKKIDYNMINMILLLRNKY